MKVSEDLTCLNRTRVGKQLEKSTAFSFESMPTF
jgi:hypothetical protein